MVTVIVIWLIWKKEDNKREKKVAKLDKDPLENDGSVSGKFLENFVLFKLVFLQNR